MPTLEPRKSSASKELSMRTKTSTTMARIAGCSSGRVILQSVVRRLAPDMRGAPSRRAGHGETHGVGQKTREHRVAEGVGPPFEGEVGLSIWGARPEPPEDDHAHGIEDHEAKQYKERQLTRAWQRQPGTKYGCRAAQDGGQPSHWKSNLHLWAAPWTSAALCPLWPCLRGLQGSYRGSGSRCLLPRVVQPFLEHWHDLLHLCHLEVPA